jgi:hypothetical protein
MVTSIPAHKNPPLKLPTWVLWLGLLGIFNFLAGCWFLLPPREDSTIYFWFVEFYTYTLLPSIVFFLLGIIILVLWFSRFMEKSWKKAVVLSLGLIAATLCFMPAFGTIAFVSTLRIIGKVSQDHRIYYLVKDYNDEAPTYSFCESDAIGFAGHCRYIAWKGDDNDPKIYIDQNTNLIAVKSENPSFTWTNSTPPSCVNDVSESDDYVGGCSP